MGLLKGAAARAKNGRKPQKVHPFIAEAIPPHLGDVPTSICVGPIDQQHKAGSVVPACSHPAQATVKPFSAAGHLVPMEVAAGRGSKTLGTGPWQA